MLGNVAMLLGWRVVGLDRMAAEKIENLIVAEVLRWWKQRCILSPNPFTILVSGPLEPLPIIETCQKATSCIISIVSLYNLHYEYQPHFQAPLSLPLLAVRLGTGSDGKLRVSPFPCAPHEAPDNNIYEKSQFDSLVWGSLTLAPIMLRNQVGLHDIVKGQTYDSVYCYSQCEANCQTYMTSWCEANLKLV